MEWFWSVNGVIMPTPDGVTFDEYDFDAPSTGRPESGYMHRERVRANLNRYSLTFTDLSAEQAIQIRTAIMPAQFTATFQFFYGLESFTMYAGDRHWAIRFDNEGIAHINLQMQLVEY